MEFSKLTLKEMEEVKPLLKGLNVRTTDYSAGATFMWRDFFSVEYAWKNGVFYSRFLENGTYYYSLPLGIPFERGIEQMKKDLGQEKFSFYTVPEGALSVFAPYECEISEQEDYFDYLYSPEDLAFFAGKKYGGQRNLTHQFAREFPTFEYCEITKETLPEIERFLKERYQMAQNPSEIEIEEEKKVFEVLRHFDEYGFFGSVLKTENGIVGFSLGEQIDDTIWIHIEKADKTVKGAYQTLVSQFAKRYAVGKAQYINREEDMGDLGLRTSKQSYHPCRMIKKYLVKML